MLLSAGILKPGAGAMTIEYLVSVIQGLFGFYYKCLEQLVILFDRTPCKGLFSFYHKNYTLKLN